MNFRKKLKSIVILVFALGFLFATATTSCGNKKAAEDTEHTEHPTEGDEHPKSDSTAGEHPSN